MIVGVSVIGLAPVGPVASKAVAQDIEQDPWEPFNEKTFEFKERYRGELPSELGNILSFTVFTQGPK